MFRTAVALAALAAAALLSMPAEAQWKWKDKTGHTQYSDLPPPISTPEQDILARPGASKARNGNVSVVSTAPASAPVAASGTASGVLAPRTTDSDLEARRKVAEAEQAAKVKAEQARIAAARADNCNRAKGQLATLDSGMRLARANDKGEREVLDDKQRADETKRMRDTIAADCK